LQADLSPRAGIGPVLRRARESRGVSLEAASRTTRIRPRYLAALEDDAGADQFPGPVYARFFLKEYARYLEIDDAPLVTALEERTAPPPAPLQVVGELEPPRRWVGLIIRVVAIASMFGLVAYSVLQARTGSSSPVAGLRAHLTEHGLSASRTHASVGVPQADIPIRVRATVLAPTHMEVYVNGERVVKRTVYRRHFFFQVPAPKTGPPVIDVEADDGAAIRLVVNGKRIITARASPFHARFVSSDGRTVRA
jgi:hypothetical protein